MQLINNINKIIIIIKTVTEVIIVRVLDHGRNNEGSMLNEEF